MDDSSRDVPVLGSITMLYDRMRTGDDDAAMKLWDQFAGQLAALAQRRLDRRLARRVVDGEDAVIDVFDTVQRRAREGIFPKVESREDLWRLLLTITDRKCKSLNRHFSAEKRGGKATFVERPSIDSSEPDPPGISESPTGPGTETAAAVASETYGHLMALLDNHDRKLRLAEMAELRMVGWSNQEVAELTNLSEKTIERRFRLIRQIWREWDPRPPSPDVGKSTIP